MQQADQVWLESSRSPGGGSGVESAAGLGSVYIGSKGTAPRCYPPVQRIAALVPVLKLMVPGQTFLFRLSRPLGTGGTAPATGPAHVLQIHFEGGPAGGPL